MYLHSCPPPPTKKQSPNRGSGRCRVCKRKHSQKGFADAILGEQIGKGRRENGEKYVREKYKDRQREIEVKKGKISAKGAEIKPKRLHEE
jgi:hypothetical protein